MVLCGATGATLAVPAGSRKKVRDLPAIAVKQPVVRSVVAPNTQPARTDSSVTFPGNTAGGPTATRTESLCDGVSDDSIAYRVQHFTVSTPGIYSIISLQEYDGFAAIYTPSYDPLNPGTNCLAANDDGRGVGESQVAGLELAPATDYYLVTTGRDNTEAGTFSNSIFGPGTISGVGVAVENAISGSVPSGAGNVTFSLTARSTGANGDTNVNVTDTLPAGTTYVSDTCSGGATGASWTWNIGTLAAAATRTCSLTVATAGSGCPKLFNSASITGDAGIVATAVATNVTSPVVDGSFETGIDGTAWTQTGTTVSPLCDENCARFGGTRARTHRWHIWFGGWDDHTETGSVTQSIVVPTAATALTFWIEITDCNAGQGTADFARLTIDGTEVWREDATSPNCGEETYREVSVPLGAGVANGAAHTFSFESTQNGDGQLTSWFIDDVSIDVPTCGSNDHIFSDGFDPQVR